VQNRGNWVEKRVRGKQSGKRSRWNPRMMVVEGGKGGRGDEWGCYH
jgi:hypothetical protein